MGQMPKITKYMLVCDIDKTVFRHTINKLISNGWSLYGNFHIEKEDNVTTYLHEMVKISNLQINQTSKIKKYMLVCDINKTVFQHTINKLISDGWTLYGNFHIEKKDNVTTYLHEMLKFKKECELVDADLLEEVDEVDIWPPREKNEDDTVENEYEEEEDIVAENEYEEDIVAKDDTVENEYEEEDIVAEDDTSENEEDIVAEEKSKLEEIEKYIVKRLRKLKKIN